MFQDNYPVFSRDMILSAAMLENVKSYPRDMLEILYKDYSDGVVMGAGMKVLPGNQVRVESGIVKFHDILYHMAEPVVLSDFAIAREQIIRIHFEKKEEQNGEIKNESSLSVCGLEEMGKEDMELCRFQLKDGAVLRQDYKNFKDLATVHNTINLVDVPCAAPVESTLSPLILYYFGKEMLGYNLSNGYDITFTAMCMQKQPISRLFIEKYIERRVPNAHKGRLTNQQLHSYLIQVLDAARSGKNTNSMNRGMSRRMLVD